MTVPIQIRREDVVRDIRELASRQGRPITDAIADLVRAELERVRRAETYEERMAGVMEIVREFNALPHTGRRLTDDDLYDEDGFPK